MVYFMTQIVVIQLLLKSMISQPIKLSLKKVKLLQLASYVCQSYGRWKTYPEEFCVDYDLRNKTRQTLLYFTHTMPCKLDLIQAINEIEILDLQGHTDWFISNTADFDIWFTSD